MRRPRPSVPEPSRGRLARRERRRSLVASAIVLALGPLACVVDHPFYVKPAEESATETGEGVGSTTSSGGATTTGASAGSTGGETSGAAGVCGDGVVDRGEACDDGNAEDGDACTNACAEPFCGDGIVYLGFEECDDGNADNSDGCVEGCFYATCGDGFVGPGEACDDGDGVDDNACTNACALPTCGDGVLQAGEACDDGDDDNSDECLSTCVAASCGDGWVRAGVEECDDGDAVNANGCSLLCHLPPVGVKLGVGEATEVFGGSGEMFSDTCPKDQVIFGFEGWYGNFGGVWNEANDNYHGQIRGLCGIPSISVENDAFVVTVTPGALLPLRGGTAGQAPEIWSRTCPPGDVLVSFKGRYGDLVDGLIFGCAKPKILEDADGYSLAMGPLLYLPEATASNGGAPFPEQLCPTSQVAIGQVTVVEPEVILHGFGMLCGEGGLVF
ncbi:MAG: DUF4215 domain-containing protein [Myxococcales bacterium]|nr:DUF4215 domain-containing protein [Myxococcales bacterium]